MPLYVYEKAIPVVPPPPPPKLPFSTKRLVLHLLPASTSILGLFLIGFVVWPIFSYELTRDTASAYTASGLLNPRVDSLEVTSPKVVSSLDFTKASNWFPTAGQYQDPATLPNAYSLSIPKLKINTALVRADTLDLSQSLIHYPGTALPGQPGSPVIFGHSILPQFYNPKNYMAIFSTLPTLDLGDTINVSYDNVAYTYTVTNKYEVYPDDLSPLTQQYDAKRLRLITCVPPGLKTRRLVVEATLQSS